MRLARARRQPRTVPMPSRAQLPEQAPPPPVFVLLFESADDVAAKAPAQFPAHKVRMDEFHARGELLMVGTFGDPQAEGSMAIFAPGRAQRNSWRTIRSCATAWCAPGRSGSGKRPTGTSADLPEAGLEPRASHTN